MQNNQENVNTLATETQEQEVQEATEHEHESADETHDESSETAESTDASDKSEDEGQADNEGDKPKGELPEWMKERLAREKRKTDRERAEKEMLLNQMRALGMQMPGQVSQQTYAQPAQPQQPIDPTQPLTKADIDRVLQEREIEARRNAEASVKHREFLDFQTKLNAGHDKFDDFEDVLIRDTSLPLSQFMLDGILKSPNPDAFLYHAATKNRSRLEEIAKMHPLDQRTEFAIWEREFRAQGQSAAQKKTVTKAPAPAGSPSKQSAGGAQKSPSEMTPDEFTEWSFKQKRASKARR